MMTLKILCEDINPMSFYNQEKLGINWDNIKYFVRFGHYYYSE